MNGRRLAVAVLLAVAACGGDSPPGDPDAMPDARLPPDARLAPCGIVEPGSRCADSTRIERCEGTSIVTESCDAGVCGIDPAVGAGVTCVSLPAACGKVTNGGKCSGSILTRCLSSKLKVVDCAAQGTECREEFGAGRCTNDCAEDNVSAQGTCTTGGAAIMRCAFVDGSYRVETDACPAGTSCTPAGPETGYPTCVPGCGTVGAGGVCDGDLLRRCSGGVIAVTDCAATGEVCVWSGDEVTGYDCAPAGTSGALRVSGVLRYEDRVRTLTADGPLRPAAAKGATVAVIDEADGRVLATAGAADDGRYLIRFDAPPGGAVHVLAISAGAGHLRPVRVLRPDGLLHGFASASFAAAADSSVDLLVTQQSGAGGAFAILDALVTGLDTTRALLDVTEPVPLVAIWARGLQAISSEDSATIWIGGTFDDDDSYDDDVIVHELGHYVEQIYGRSDSPGGFHRLFTPTVPTLAWSEGWATYFSSVVRADPTYVDSKLLGGFEFDIDLDQTLADPTKTQRQQISENTVAEILWDLGDGGTGDDDPARGQHGDVVRVQNRYFRDRVDRGSPGVELVDFLDGFLALAGAGRCATTRTVVESRRFPYDFVGPVSCP